MSTSERTTGWRAIFSAAPIYRLAQSAVGADRFRDVVTGELLRIEQHDRVLDVGCGTADILDHLPPCEYLGFDPSSNYTSDAQERFGDRGKFVTGAVEDLDPGLVGQRSVAFAIGVLHHLDDDAAVQALTLARECLIDGGRFVSIDPTLVDGQHPVARFLVSRDRGQHVRSPEATRTLVSSVFGDVSLSVRHDLLRTPYSHVIAEVTTTS